MIKQILSFTLFLVFLLGTITTTKLSKKLQSEMMRENMNENFDIMIHMKDQVNFDALPLDLLDHSTKGRVIVEMLQQTAKSSQKGLIEAFNLLGYKYQSFWINNVIVVHHVPRGVINILEKREEIRLITSDSAFQVLDSLETTPQPVIENNTATVEWNIQQVGADKVWQKGFTGKGRVVASADTGVDFTHEAIRNNYRGLNAETGELNHNYHWWDAIKEKLRGNSCGINVKYPCDDNGHGTHTVGTMLGGTSSRKFGVAPGAQWIGCKNMDSGIGRPSTYNGCLQFFLAPTDLEGKNPNPDLRPDSVGNSYGCPRSELCEPEDLKSSVEALRRAGVFMSVAAGNSGSSCSSINDPPGHYAASISVGAVDRSGNIAYFSSRGPITIDGSNRRKPDICAPGVGVYSCLPKNRYGSFSGTSMAAPHIAGAVALLWEAKPSLVRNIDATQKVLEATALPKESTACKSQGIPNNVYGFGNLQVDKAVDSSQQ